MSSTNSHPSLTHSDLASDIYALLSLPPQTSQQLSNLLHSDLPTTSTSPLPGANRLLSSFSPSASKSDPEAINAAVNLSAAYTRDMRALQRQGLEEGLEKAGQGIEGVRERAEGVQTALAGVKL